MTDAPAGTVDDDPPQDMEVPHFPRFDADALRATAQLWRTVAGGLRATTDTTQFQVNTAAAVWTGEAHDAFAQEWATLAGTVQELSVELDAVARHLDQLVEELEHQRREFELLLAEIGLTLLIGAGLSVFTFGGAAAVSGVKAAFTIRRLWAIIELVGQAAARFALRAAGGSLRAMSTRFVVNAGIYGGTQVAGNVITDPGGNPFRDISPADLSLAAVIGVFLPFHGAGHAVFRGAANNVTTEALIELYKNHRLDPGSLALAGVVGGVGGKLPAVVGRVRPNRGTAPGESADVLRSELAKNGVKHTPEGIVDIRRTSSGKIVFMENGNSVAGLTHILERHGPEFRAAGIPDEKVPDLVMSAITDGKHVGDQVTGRGSRPIYEVLFEGQTYNVAVTVSDNGFVVGANLKGGTLK
ncbi:WXG100 family type VII secretion target [Actinoplanes sp. CA-252034]|uniref:WXG100 family type VII secretion target n=1 Tax=Actinoplanes sp. CA-252034 TaxID=3239906 RepID=UPI003D958E6D